MVSEDVADVVAAAVEVVTGEECAVAGGGVFLAAHEGDGGLQAFRLDQVDALDKGAGHGHAAAVRPSLRRVEGQQFRPAAEQCAGEDVRDFLVGNGAVEVVAVEWGKYLLAGVALTPMTVWTCC